MTATHTPIRDTGALAALFAVWVSDRLCREGLRCSVRQVRAVLAGASILDYRLEARILQEIDEATA
jgi:hypothetical protein